MNYLDVLLETDKIYEWIKELPYVFNSTVFQGLIVLVFPNRPTFDCVLDEICSGKYADKVEWATAGRTRIVVWHKSL